MIVLTQEHTQNSKARLNGCVQVKSAVMSILKKADML